MTNKQFGLYDSLQKNMYETGFLSALNYILTIFFNFSFYQMIWSWSLKKLWGKILNGTLTGIYINHKNKVSWDSFKLQSQVTFIMLPYATIPYKYRHGGPLTHKMMTKKSELHNFIHNFSFIHSWIAFYLMMIT